MKTVSHSVSGLIALILLNPVILAWNCQGADETTPPVLLTPQSNWHETLQQMPNGTEVRFAPGDYITPPDGLSLVGKREITLIAEGQVSIVCERIDRVVMTLQDCSNVVLQGLHLTHRPPVSDGNCAGGVLDIQRSSLIYLTDCHLDGCGAYAITSSESYNISVWGGKATHNSLGVFWFGQSGSVRIVGVEVSGNYKPGDSQWTHPVLSGYDTYRVLFSNNLVKDNKNGVFFDQGLNDMGIFNNEFSGNEFEIYYQSELPSMGLLGRWKDEGGQRYDIDMEPTSEYVSRYYLTVVPVSPEARRIWTMGTGFLAGAQLRMDKIPAGRFEEEEYEGESFDGEPGLLLEQADGSATIQWESGEIWTREVPAYAGGAIGN